MLLDVIHFLKDIDQIIFHYIDALGVYFYLLLFGVVFTKTAFVILTFLPGDSTVFTSGALAANSKLDLMVLFFMFILATALADSNNYFIGRSFSKLHKKKTKRSLLFRFLPDNALDKAHQFLVDYDRIAITLSRFVPLMRTMTPFISGYTKISYWTFLRYNFLGAVIWTTVWLGAGFILGNIPWVEDNLVFTLGIISVFVFAFTGYAYLKQLKKKHKVTL